MNGQIGGSCDRLDEFRIFLQKQGRSESTINSYCCSVSCFFALFEEPSVENLKSYREFLLKSYSFNTVNNRIYGMNRYLKFLCGDAAAYCMQTVKEQRRMFLNTVISQRDYEKLKRRLKADEKYYWYFVVRFLGATGARISELLQIKIEDLKLGYLDLYSKGGKIRRLYFPRVLCDEAVSFYESCKIASGFIFLNHHGRPITARGISSQLKKLARQYGIEPNTVYPHSFRHRFAKNFLKRFNDISLLADLMGHDSIETTRIYLTRSSMEQKELLDRIVTW